jgi:hypothetical protein
LVAQVSFLVVARNSFRFCLLTYHTSCAIVSVFWLRREIVFGCIVYKKDSYLVSLIERESASKCVYFVRSITRLLCISLLCHISFLHCMDQKQIANQGIFLMRSKLSITAYLFLALYGSTTLQSQSFLKNIENSLCK